MELLDLLRCAPSYTTRPVEKQRFSRILCGFLLKGAQKGTKIARSARAPLRSAPVKQVWRNAETFHRVNLGSIAAMP
jgi:hypothetical protein